MSSLFSKVAALPKREGIGDPRLTIAMRKDYGAYAIDKDSAGGGDRMTWEEYLASKGYSLDKRGHVFKVEATNDADR